MNFLYGGGVIYRRSSYTSSVTERNDLCRCGSGKKFKKCHGDAHHRRPPESISPAIIELLEQTARKQQAHRSNYGFVRPIIHADFADHKVVVVGSAIHWSKKWRTFPDFLSDYIKKKIPEKWYKSQLEKPLESRHPIAQWYYRYCEFQQRNNTRDENGLFSGEPDGPSLAFLVLAYELYLLEDHLSLQKKLIGRLLLPKGFQGARYEITVAATMIRAGFALGMEEEDDPSRQHPEFIATHTRSGLRVAVEAKSRHREGVLGLPGELHIGDNLAHDVRRLFRDAVAKAANGPLFIFIDANLPPSVAVEMASSWQPQFTSMVVKEAKPIDENGITVGHPHNLLMVTNIGYHYGAVGEPAPPPLFYSHWPDPRGCRYPLDARLIRAVEDSLEKYGLIPNEFETA